jgi:hypothetical protein
MDTLADMRSAVQSDLTIGSESTYLNETTVDLALNRAYRKIGGLFRWPELEDAKITSTVADQDYYDYPDTWQPDSMWKVQVSSERYGEDPDGSPMNFQDWLDWKEDNPNSTEKKWTSQHRRFFITPTPTASGTNDLYVWGQKAVTEMTSGASTTIFSYSMSEVNEAIVLEAVAILQAKGQNDEVGKLRSVEAMRLATIAWGKIRQNQMKYEKSHSMFNVPDFYGKSSSEETIGNFDL